MKLKLDRPLIFLDIESTGPNPRQDRIIDLALIKVMLDGSRQVHTFRVHPERPIPPAASAIHHITDADVAGCPPFREIALKVRDLFDGCDLAGYNILRFDLVMLAEEFGRAGVPFDPDSFRVVDAQSIFHKREPRDLSAAVSFFCNGRCHAGAHSALADAEAVIDVLEGQMRKYPDLPCDMAGLDEYCRPPRNPEWADRSGRLKWDNGELVINFGAQYIGQRVRDLVKNKPKFLKWILTSDFPLDTKTMIHEALQGRFPKPPPELTAGES